MSTPRVGIIIKYNDKYLSVFQSASKLWGFPKGQLQDEDKELIDCGIRELGEETGIVLNKDIFKLTDLIHIKRGKHHHYYYVKELLYEPECKIDNNEIVDYRWISLKDFMNVSNISFFTEQVLKKLNLFDLRKRIQCDKKTSPITKYKKLCPVGCRETNNNKIDIIKSINSIISPLSRVF